MRSREHLGNSQYIQQIDGSKNTRNLSFIEGATYVGLIPLAYASFVEGLHWNQRAPRKVIVKKTLELLPKPLNSLSEKVK